MKLYLDDLRTCPAGYTLARSVEQAIQRVEMAKSVGEPFEAASLDHDLGACEDCLDTESHWKNEGAMPYCDHVGTGLTFVDWMTSTGNWPLTRPAVHSMNPSGKFRMQRAIERHFVQPATSVVE